MPLLALLVVLVMTSHASAQDEREAARAQFRAGTRAFEADDFAGALELYERAFQLEPHDAVRFNIAVCLERLGRFRRAAEEYRLAAESEELDAEARARAADALAAVRARLGTVVIAGAEGFAIELDGAPLCVAPCEAEIDPGAHVLRGRGPHGEVDLHVEIARGERRTVAFAADDAARLDAPIAPIAPVVPAADAPAEGPSAARVPGLAIAGAVLSAVGVAGAIGFGVRTSDLAASYDAMPTAPVRDEGLATEGAFHAALGLTLVGGVLVIVEFALSP